MFGLDLLFVSCDGCWISFRDVLNYSIMPKGQCLHEHVCIFFLYCDIQVKKLQQPHSMPEQHGSSSMSCGNPTCYLFYLHDVRGYLLKLYHQHYTFTAVLLSLSIELCHCHEISYKALLNIVFINNINLNL